MHGNVAHLLLDTRWEAPPTLKRTTNMKGTRCQAWLEVLVGMQWLNFPGITFIYSFYKAVQRVKLNHG